MFELASQLTLNRITKIFDLPKFKSFADKNKIELKE